MEHELWYQTSISSTSYNYWKARAEQQTVALEHEKSLNRKLSAELNTVERAKKEAEARKRVTELELEVKRLDAEAQRLTEAVKSGPTWLHVKELELEIKRLQNAVQDLTGVRNGDTAALRGSNFPPVMRALQEAVNSQAARADAAEAELAKSKKDSIGTMRMSIGKVIDEENRVRELEAALKKEKDIRQRVWERFKRVRRDAAQGSINLQQARVEIEKLEKQLAAAQKASKAMDGNAARFATLAYAILEAEDKEAKGKEPSWP